MYNNSLTIRKGFDQSPIVFRMKRRAVLTTLGASAITLTGCNTQGSQETDTPNTNTTGTETTRPPSTHRTGPRAVSIASVGTVPSDVPVTPSVTVLRSSVTANQTARIKVSLKNTSEQTIWSQIVRIPAFSDFITDEGPNGNRLLLLKPEVDYETVRSNCWRADLAKYELNHAYTDVAGDVKYSPGATKTTSFDIYGHPQNTGPCLTPGEYKLNSSYRIDTDTNEEKTKWEFTWGFSIMVKKR